MLLRMPNNTQNRPLVPVEFTRAWRAFFKYGTDYSKLNVNDIWEAAQIIYEDFPELLEAARKMLFG